MAVEKVLLGYGIFKVGDTPVGLTRGGGSFAVETEYRQIEADGDYGPVEDRITIDSQVAKLKLNALTAFSAEDMKKHYPGLVETDGTVTATLKIATDDYHSISWEGQTLDGKPVIINLENAINLGNIEFTLEDKNEVIPELEFTATYKENTRNTAPWGVVYGPLA